MKFKKYQHVERLNTTGCDGLLDGEVFVFPKIDGTNGSIWFDNGDIKAGSRNRELTIENDNAGFLKAVLENESLCKMVKLYDKLRFFGEWLVPHSLKTYSDDAWRKFYVFDVMLGDKYLTFDEYSKICDEWRIDYIPLLFSGENLTHDQISNHLEKNTFLLKENSGYGEGVVVKRYDFKNKYGRTVWGKIVSNEFKQKHNKEMGAPKLQGKSEVEQKIVTKYLTESLIEKEYAKLSIDGWESKKIPQLIGIIYNCFITEELWNVLKKEKSPTINFKRLNSEVVKKIRITLTEVF